MNEAGGRREVASMAWPLAVGMLSFTLMGLVDTLLMGHVGTEAQAGVGLGASLTFACLAFFRGLVTGAQSLVAASHGARDKARWERAAGAALLVGAASGALVFAAALFGHRALLDAVVADAEIAASCAAYLGCSLWGLPWSLVAYGALAALQGLGDTRSRMWVSLAGNLLNVGLDLLLIFGAGPIPALGEAGAGIATACSALLMAGLYLWRYGQLFGVPRLPGVQVLWASLEVGFPAGCQYALNVAAFVVINLALARVGAAHLAASQIVLNVISLSFLPGFGVGEAGGVLVGRYLGAGRRETAVRTLRSARGLALALMGACGLLFALCGEEIAGLFTQDDEVLRLAGKLMLIAAGFQLLDAVAMVHLCALRGAGDTRFTLVATAGSAWLLTVPLTLILGVALGWGALGAWLGLTAKVAAVAALTGWRVRGLARGRIGRLDLLLGR